MSTPGPEGGTSEAAPRPRRRRLPPEEWESWDDDRLMQLRLCDLDLRITGSPVEPRIQEHYAEMEARGLSFRPHVWLSDEWFTPEGVAGIAIPFYLLHPRLRRLERRFMGEVEGGNVESLMRILRHETGHAIDTAFGLRRRKSWREVFGKASRRYPSRYYPRPGSRNYVLHLGHLYATLMAADLLAGSGVGLIDPHGDLADEILRNSSANRTAGHDGGCRRGSERGDGV